MFLNQQPVDRASKKSFFISLMVVLAFLGELYACGQAPQPQRGRTELPTPKVPPGSTEVQVPASAPKVAPQIGPDGSVVTSLPDGGRRITRPGVCGYTVVRPDGTRNIVTCAQVPIATPPATPPLSDQVNKWLRAHSESLLSVIRSQVDETSVKNYLATSEANKPDIYNEIRLRTDLIRLLVTP